MNSMEYSGIFGFNLYSNSSSLYADIFALLEIIINIRNNTSSYCIDV